MRDLFRKYRLRTAHAAFLGVVTLHDLKEWRCQIGEILIGQIRRHCCAEYLLSHRLIAVSLMPQGGAILSLSFKLFLPEAFVGQ